MSDLDATVAWAGKNGGGTDKLGITGFCWGGRIVWLYAAHNPAVDAGVDWYGRLVGSTADLHPSQPVDIAANLQGPVLGLYGVKAASLTPDSHPPLTEAQPQSPEPAPASNLIAAPHAPPPLP